jgi:hypothetical protein
LKLFGLAQIYRRLVDAVRHNELAARLLDRHRAASVSPSSKPDLSTVKPSGLFAAFFDDHPENSERPGGRTAHSPRYVNPD